MIPSVRRHHVDGAPSARDFLDSQQDVQKVIATMYALAPWLGGQLLDSELDATGHRLDGITLTAGVAKSIPHRLGKKYRGGFVVRDFGANASAIHESASDEKSVTLVSTTTCKIYFWAWG